MARLGNPDIPVSQRVKEEDRQRARREERADGAVTGEESADGAVTVEGDEDERRSTSRNIPEDRRFAEQSASTPRGRPTEGQRNPEQQRLRHVPGGTWLKQEPLTEQKHVNKREELQIEEVHLESTEIFNQ
ncbi:hypothetical protein NDU88_004663 [Pleurodeles waltl]|uniref:Uncharacterized protein n=1 Tax=Pleurodeles waltl TaxID=8319 RepID=A0AAV7RI05_PLEWA|nr:hypothetical protein NDU88_004663 [Pleurodeles waltl]